MNKSKRNLILAALIVDFVSVGLEIVALVVSCLEKYDPTLYATYNEFMFYYILDIVVISIDLTLVISAGICLAVAIRDGGKHFMKEKKVYLAGFILNLLASPFSIASILLLIAQFKYVDIEYVEEKKEDVVEVKPSDEEIKQKIEKLRKLKDEGSITEDEFNQEILKLL